MARAHEVQGERHGGFQAEHTGCGAVELDVFLDFGVRRVIGGDAIDRAVDDAGDDRLDVGCAVRSGGITLVARVVFGAGLVGEREVVRSDLAGDRQAAALGLAHERDRAADRHVRDVVPGAGPLDQLDVARDHDRLGLGRLPAQTDARGHLALVHHTALGEAEVFGVLHHRQLERLCVLERAAHQPGADDGSTIVGHGDDAAFEHLAELGQIFAREPLGHRADRSDPHEVGLAGAPGDQVGDGAAVVDRPGVRHAAHGGEPARGGGAAAPEAMSSLYSCPGSRRCVWMSTKPGVEPETIGLEYLPGYARLDPHPRR